MGTVEKWLTPPFVLGVITSLVATALWAVSGRAWSRLVVPRIGALSRRRREREEHHRYMLEVIRHGHQPTAAMAYIIRRAVATLLMGLATLTASVGFVVTFIIVSVILVEMIVTRSVPASNIKTASDLTGYLLGVVPGLILGVLAPVFKRELKRLEEACGMAYRALPAPPSTDAPLAPP